MTLPTDSQIDGEHHVPRSALDESFRAGAAEERARIATIINGHMQSFDALREAAEGDNRALHLVRVHAMRDLLRDIQPRSASQPGTSDA